MLLLDHNIRLIPTVHQPIDTEVFKQLLSKRNNGYENRTSGLAHFRDTACTNEGIIRIINNIGEVQFL